MNLKVQQFLLAQYSHTEVHSISTKGIFREIDVHLKSVASHIAPF